MLLVVFTTAVIKELELKVMVTAMVKVCAYHHATVNGDRIHEGTLTFTCVMVGCNHINRR